MAEQTQEQYYAQNAMDRVGRCAAYGTRSKLDDLNTIQFLQPIASGERVTVSAEEYEEYQQLKAERDQPSEDGSTE